MNDAERICTVGRWPCAAPLACSAAYASCSALPLVLGACAVSRLPLVLGACAVPGDTASRLPLVLVLGASAPALRSVTTSTRSPRVAAAREVHVVSRPHRTHAAAPRVRLEPARVVATRDQPVTASRVLGLRV
jgi:hypothetical protein